MFHGKIYTIKHTISIFIRVTRKSKAMQTTAIRTVANSLSENEVILLTLLISKRYIPHTDLLKSYGITARFQQINALISPPDARNPRAPLPWEGTGKGKRKDFRPRGAA